MRRTKPRRVRLEHGVPIPEKTREIYLWSKLKVGDCLTFENADYNTVNVARWKAAKRLGFKFTMRKLHHGLIRVWRIE